MLSQGTNNAPAWTTFNFPSTGTDKILSYVGGTGWSLIDTYNVVTGGSGSIGLLKRDTDTTVSSQTQSTKFLREDGIWAAPSYTTNVSANNITLTTAAQNYISIGNTNYTIAIPSSDPYSSARTPEAHNHGYLKNDGTTVMAYNNQGDDTYPNNGVPVETGDKIIIADRNNSGGDNKLVRSAITFGSYTTTFLRNDGQWATPTGGTSYSLAVEGVPGLLKVDKDADANVGYENTENVIAIPIFYGTIDKLKVFSKEDGDRDAYTEGDEYTGHYVNVRDVVNGIIKDQRCIQLLAAGLGIEPPKIEEE